MSSGSAAGPQLPLATVLRDPSAPYLVPLLVLLATRAWFWFRLPNAYEDAYITFRYARSLAEGLGPVFNAGERVMGFSSPLWTAWVSLGVWLTHEPVAWARGWSVVADAVAITLAARLLDRHVGRMSAWCFALFFAAWPYFAATAVSGMESSALVALTLIAATLGARGSALAGPLIGAVALTRPEGIAVAALLLPAARGRDRLVAAGIGALGWGALGVYFGSPIPQSVIAKAQVYGSPGPWAGRAWWEWLLPAALGRWPNNPELAQLFQVSAVMAPAAVLGVPALWRLWREVHRALPCAVAGMLAVWLGYVLVGAAYFSWYLCVPLAGIASLAAIGLPRVVRGTAVPAALLVFVAGSWTVFPRLYEGRALQESATFAEAGFYLRDHGRSGESVMLEPIGIAGWISGLRVVDEVGLVSPEVARRRVQGPGWYGDMVRARRPEWLVARRALLERPEGFAGAGAPFRDEADRKASLSEYAVRTVVAPEAGDGALVVLRRIR
ncbi:MAG: hypothetical protein HZB25_08435 [Candidatus Eisenbacteria bacterium]|nr:hypothetical protein [Candidatus Eisenbacteria bacterium]